MSRFSLIIFIAAVSKKHHNLRCLFWLAVSSSLVCG